MGLLVQNLQAWAKCLGCEEILWTESSPHDQACGCACGGIHIKNTIIIGTPDNTFTEAEMEAILEAEV